MDNVFTKVMGLWVWHPNKPLFFQASLFYSSNHLTWLDNFDLISYILKSFYQPGVQQTPMQMFLGLFVMPQGFKKKQTYRKQFLQSSFRKYCKKLGANIPRRKQSKDNRIWDQGTHTSDKFIIEWSIDAKDNFPLFCISYLITIWQAANKQLIAETTTIRINKTKI